MDMDAHSVEHGKINARLDSICNKMDIKVADIEKSITTAKNELDRRLEGMNEFRNQLTQQANLFISKTEVDLKLEKLNAKLEPLERCIDIRTGSSKWVDHIITVLITLAAFLIMHYVWRF